MHWLHQLVHLSSQRRGTGPQSSPSYPGFHSLCCGSTGHCRGPGRRAARQTCSVCRCCCTERAEETLPHRSGFHLTTSSERSSQHQNPSGQKNSNLKKSNHHHCWQLASEEDGPWEAKTSQEGRGSVLLARSKLMENTETLRSGKQPMPGSSVCSWFQAGVAVACTGLYRCWEDNQVPHSYVCLMTCHDTETREWHCKISHYIPGALANTWLPQMHAKGK